MKKLLITLLAFVLGIGWGLVVRGQVPGDSEWSDLQSKYINEVAYAHKLATGGAGTNGDPWTGFEAAIEALSDSHVHFPAGEYLGRLDISNNNMLLTGDGQGVTIFNATADSASAGFNVTGSGFTLYGMSIVGNSGNTNEGHGVFCSGATDFRVNHVTITLAGKEGISVNNCARFWIERNFIDGPEHGGITVSNGASEGVIKSNVINDPVDDSAQTARGGITVFGGGSPTTNSISIESNLVVSSNRNGIRVTSSGGVVPDNIQIIGNEVDTTGNVGISWAESEGITCTCTNSVVANNLVTDAGVSGIYLTAGTTDTVVTGNVVDSCSQDATAEHPGFRLNALDGAITGVTFSGNTAVGATTGRFLSIGDTCLDNSNCTAAGVPCACCDGFESGTCDGGTITDISVFSNSQRGTAQTDPVSFDTGFEESVADTHFAGPVVFGYDEADFLKMGAASGAMNRFGDASSDIVLQSSTDGGTSYAFRLPVSGAHRWDYDEDATFDISLAPATTNVLQLDDNNSGASTRKILRVLGTVEADDGLQVGDGTAQDVTALTIDLDSNKTVTWDEGEDALLFSPNVRIANAIPIFAFDATTTTAAIDASFSIFMNDTTAGDEESRFDFNTISNGVKAPRLLVFGVENSTFEEGAIALTWNSVPTNQGMLSYSGFADGTWGLQFTDNSSSPIMASLRSAFDFLPTVTNTYALGTAALAWASAYISGTLYTDTVAEYTSAAGVTIDSVVLKDGTVKPPSAGGAFPPATCTPYEIFIDTDETVDTNCTTTADNSLCLCTATDTWTALENN